MDAYRIAPSLLAADFARLGEEAQAVINAGADVLHLDAMDNHFVPHLTVGPLVCAALRQFGIRAEINVHLMVKPIDRLIVEFAKAGASSITFHAEATEEVDAAIALIHQHGCKAGLALKPATSLSSIDVDLVQLDLILVMAVEPGEGGQEFIPATLEKIKQVRQIITSSGKPMRLSVDGGVKIANIASIARAGADTFVAGTAIFQQPDYTQVIAEMRAELKRV